MTKSIVSKSHSQSLLTHLIANNQLVQEIQSLDSSIVKKIIRHIGLEDCSEFIMLLTSQQIQEVMDEDTWTSSRPGDDDRLNGERFLLWIEMLLEIGDDFAAERISEMDEDILILALSQFIIVMDEDELALMASFSDDQGYSESKYLEKAIECTFNQEIDGHLIMSKSSLQWETILGLLMSLQNKHRDSLHRILERIQIITMEQIEEHDGLYNLLKESDMLEEDVRDDRQQRREKEGYVGPSTAKAFIKLIEETSLEQLLIETEPDHISKMYFRSYRPTKARTASPISPELLRILKNYRVDDASAASLKLQSQEVKSELRTRIASLRNENEESYKKTLAELNFVANVLISYHGSPKKRLRPIEAMDLAIRTCDEAISVSGTKNWDLGNDILKIFKIGWKLRKTSSASP